MNTDVEILVERQRDDLVDELLRRGTGAVRAPRADLLAIPPDVGALTPEPGRAAAPEPAMAEVVRLALAARARTGGRFDPTVHDALVSAGYATSFDDLPGGLVPAPEGDPPPCGGGLRSIR